MDLILLTFQVMVCGFAGIGGIYLVSEAARRLTSTVFTSKGEYPVQIGSIGFIHALRHFMQSHEFQLKPSAPDALHGAWWRIVDENLKTGSAAICLEYKEPGDGLNYELRMRLELIETSNINAPNTLRYEWKVGALIGGTVMPRSSPSAEVIVDYTITELRLELYAQAKARQAQLASARPALAGSLVKARNASEQSDMHSSRSAQRFVDRIVEKAYWPSPQDYNEAIQNPRAVFDNALLQSGSAELNALGLPRAASGAFASVYKMNCAGREHAVKCFLTLVHDSKDRYEMISRTVLGDDLEYTVDFEFMPSQMLIRGQRYPILRMDWVTGEPLNSYVERHLHDPAALQSLAEHFVTMMVSLRDTGIAHGDLQHGNILVTSQGIRLVDYDGMFVPGMEGMVSNELGHRNYQHPRRHPTHFGPWLDNFSALVIYISLRALAVNPELWDIGGAGDESLVFRQNDFASPDNSPLFSALSSHSDEFVRSATEALLAALDSTPDQVPYLAPNS